MQLLKTYQRRLINLGTGNRSLLLLRLSNSLHLDFQELDFLNGKPAYETLTKLVTCCKNVTLCEVADSRHAATNVISQKLKNISRQASLIKEEQGAEALFVGWPFVQGKFADGTLVRCPLLFFPVQLQKENNRWKLYKRENAEVQFNSSLLLAYAHYNQTTADETLLEFTLDAKSDIREVLLELYNVLKESSLELNFNQELFQQKLTAFRPFLKAAFEQESQPGQLKLFPEAVLGIFPQAGSYLLSDYDFLLDQPNLISSEDLFHQPDTKTITADRNQNFTLFEVDASQEVVLEEVKKGRSVVVQGPPGSGKSQLICNLVSDFSSRGKTVLVVSQKRAALEVVQQRLASAGLANFTVLIHDIKTDRKKLFEQLQRQIERVEEYRKENVAFANIYAERRFLETGKQLNQILQTFDDFRTALFDTGLCGWSVKELYLQSSPQQAFINVGSVFKNYLASTFSSFEQRLKKHLEKAVFFEAEDFILKDRRNFKNHTWQRQQEIQNLIDAIPVFLQGLASEAGFTNKTEPEVLEQLLFLMSAEKELQQVQNSIRSFPDKPLLDEVLKTKTALKKLQQQIKTLEKQFKNVPAFFQKTSGNFNQQLARATDRYEHEQQQLLGRLKWQFFAPEKQFLQKVLAENNLSSNPDSIDILKQNLALRQKLDTEILALQQVLPGLKNSPDPADFYKHLPNLKDALAIRQERDELAKQGIYEQTGQHYMGLEKLKNETGKLLALTEKFRPAYGLWLKQVTENQIKKIVAGLSFRNDLKTALAEYFEQLVAFDEAAAQFSETEHEVIANLKAMTPDPEQQLVIFKNSVFLAWITEIENQFPVLRQASDGRLQELQNMLPKLLQHQKELVFPMVHSRLRERTYQNLTYNRLGNAVTYRKLYAEVTKKRNLQPIRKLFSLFRPEITDLIPVWLASPETVSAVFPPEKNIDLIIFDEASQCFTELGLPAIYRSKQVVIAGDKQQLSPTDLYRTRWQHEPEETEELPAESLLDFGMQHLPQHLLTGHYRSKYPELIQFSNKHFYHNKLQLVPDRESFFNRPPALEFCKINGIWQNNTNQPEAEAVIKKTLELLQQGINDIGIITFNYPQQMLIRDLLEEALQQQNQEIPESIFIKNIENVQGDEKDMILISVGYAADATGQVHAQFGSLNLQGGSNRLNVVITRARLKQYIFASFLPEQLNVEKTKHSGPKLLKAYLLYARQVSENGFHYQPEKKESPKQVFWLSERLLQHLLKVNDNISFSKELPFADITVIENRQYRGVLLTDDELYNGYLSVRQAHSDVPARLQQHGWPYLQVYTRQYWQNPEVLRSKIFTFYA